MCTRVRRVVFPEASGKIEENFRYLVEHGRFVLDEARNFLENFQFSYDMYSARIIRRTRIRVRCVESSIKRTVYWDRSTSSLYSGRRIRTDVKAQTYASTFYTPPAEETDSLLQTLYYYIDGSGHDFPHAFRRFFAVQVRIFIYCLFRRFKCVFIFHVFTVCLT